VHHTLVGQNGGASSTHAREKSHSLKVRFRSRNQGMDGRMLSFTDDLTELEYEGLITSSGGSGNIQWRVFANTVMNHQLNRKREIYLNR